ncbi:MAG: glycosyltransferase family 2 protein [Candidatus Andersenbacteria bacterium]|nr:glycosyltransferase family 2 protein [Candidatus Andersenbacteria bacterium]
MTTSSITTARDASSTIGRSLQSLNFVDERIVVVDSASTDLTAQIAEQCGARVLTLPWRGYGQQKNAAADVARGQWLLYIDADEEVTPALARAISKALASNTANDSHRSIYWLRIVTIFLGRPLKHLYGHNPRLMRKNAARWTPANVHEQVVRLNTNNSPPVKLGDPDTVLITEPLIHYSHHTIRSYLDKMHRYTALDAEYMARGGRHRSGRRVQPRWWLPYYLAARQLFKLLFYRRGILDGYAGVIWCLLSAYYEWEMGKKYKKMTKPQ